MGKTLLLLLLAAPGFGAERTLQVVTPAQGIQEVMVRLGVGDVVVTGCQCQEVRASVAVRGKRWQVEKLKIAAHREGDKLTLALAPAEQPGRHPREDWTVALPANLALQVKAGVGDVRVRHVVGEVRLDLGVGDVAVEGLRGPLVVATGVGDIEVSGNWEAVGSIKLATGVGDVQLLTPYRREKGRGFAAESLQAQGPGPHPLKATARVGTIRVRLQPER